MGASFGNGGFRGLIHFADALGKMGYDVKVFDHRDRMTAKSFGWLSMPDRHFKIVPVLDVVKGTGPIVTSWLNVLMDGPRLMLKVDPERIKYRESSELVRDGFPFVRAWVQSRCEKISINNRSLSHHYNKLGFLKILPLEPYFRKELFFVEKRAKVEGLVGHQSDNRRRDVYRTIRRHFGTAVRCEGTQAQVAKRMRQCDYFVFWNRIPGCITMFQGETTGTSLFEAMACGCVCVARRHEGNKFLESVIPLVNREKDIAPIIKRLRASPKERDQIRNKSFAVVEQRFRLNDEKKANMRELIA
jgi:glycosyltransferase involved in cell wall biosynthesis